MLQYENFPSLRILVLDCASAAFLSCVADLTVAITNDEPSATPSRTVAVQFCTNGVTFAITTKTKKDKAEVQITLKRQAGEYASFWKHRTRDISMPVVFDDECYTVAVDAAATVAQLKGAAVLVRAWTEGKA